jgi:iron complex transport system permease protein
VTEPGLEPTRLRWWWIVGALGALLVVVGVAIVTGPAQLSVGSVLAAIAERIPGIDPPSEVTEQEAAIVWQLRMPRIALGLLVGAMLGIAGGAYQGSFRNPLADPYLLGVAAGAGLGATLAIAYGPETGGWIVDPLPLFAFIGGLVGVALAYLVGYTVRAGHTAVTLILAGVAVAAFLTAVQTYLQQREAETLREVYGWILGRLSTAGWGEIMLILPYVLVCSAVIFAGRRLLDVLAVGDEEAGALGLNASRVRLIVVLAATLGTAAAVAVTGLIAFVGIIVPHTVRLVVGTSYRLVIPLSMIVGGAFLVFCDLLARSLVAPAELPIGVVTAFFGAPFFAVVLKTSRGVVT